MNNLGVVQFFYKACEPKVESMGTMVDQRERKNIRRGKNEQFIGNWDVANTCNMHQYVQLNYEIRHAFDNFDTQLLCHNVNVIEVECL